MAQLQQLLEARAAAERAYHEAERDQLNDMERAMDDENESNAIIIRLHAAQQPWIQAAEAYNQAIQTDNNASDAEKVAASDYVGHIVPIELPQGEIRIVGGRRRRSASSRKSTLRRRASSRSTKKRDTRRKRRARSRSRRAH